MELLGERPVWSMSGSEMLSTLDTLEAELVRLQTYRLRVIAGLEEIGYAEELGAHDTARLLAFRYRLDSAEAHRDVRLARALPKYPTISAALPTPNPTPSSSAPDTAASDATASDAGAPGTAASDTGAGGSEPADADERAKGDSADIGARPLRPAQAHAIVGALERVAKRVPMDDLSVAERQLVELAAHLSPAELRKAGKEIGDLLDSDGPGPDEHKAYARESLTLSNVDNGVKFRGYLANENAELLRSLTHAGARPHKSADGELDPRPRDKRQADALTAALIIAAAATDTAFHPRRPTAPDLTTPSSRTTTAGPDTTAVHSDATSARSDTEAARPGATADAGTAGADGGWVPGFGAKANITVTIDFNDLKAATANATGRLVYGDALSAAAIRRLACDAKIIPLVLGSNSEPLDVGRSERLVTRAMRRALNARDKGCVVCGAPPIHCDAHHLTSWIDGGRTATNNLVLLCRRHHIDLHAGHWTITITDGTVHVSRPTWADPPPNLHSTRPTTEARPPASAPAGLRPPACAPADPCPTQPPTASRPTQGSVGSRPARGLAGSSPEQSPDEAEFAFSRGGSRPVPAPPSAGDDPAATTSAPATAAEATRSKWRADEHVRRQAARFAVWGDDPPDEPLELPRRLARAPRAGSRAGPPSATTVG
ncbi:DUF222 domain-containing protein [Kribbella sp. NPDC050470]|uniref:HNH endonuclease signature motif containing protein n=1 Tax=unclassified Kribbella TaxID=2644121 RepID=UPI003793BF3B